MTMTLSEREALLSRWIQPSSTDEQIEQERAERMVTKAVSAYAPLKSAKLNIYAKGSYPNNTNVRRDSDVDIAVECTVCQYVEFMPGQEPTETSVSSYVGEWSPSHLRAELHRALNLAFGTPAVSAGKIALTVDAVAGSRPSIDVVPSFTYILYNDSQRMSHRQGAAVFPKDRSSYIRNWPNQQLVNGRLKNTQTGKRYKRFARALKNAENKLSAIGDIPALPSYFMECLVWNVDNLTLQQGSSLSSGFRATLFELWDALDNDRTNDWTEPNDVKYLFRGGQKWTPAQAKALVLSTWQYLDY